MDRHCPVCGNAGHRPCLTKGELRLVQCERCDMVYATPVPAEYASGEFYDRSGLPFYLSPPKLESDYAPVRFAREWRLFRRYCPRGKVLDVGCSTGAFLYGLGQRHPGDYQGEGTDVVAAALDYAESRGVQVVRRSFLEEGWTPERYDAVTFWAVLEHLAEPARFLRQATRVLKPGGCLVVLVPNLRCLAVRLLGARYRYVMLDHVNYFSRATLRRFIRQAGAFETLTEGSSHWNPMVLWQDRRGGEQRVSDAARSELLRTTTRWKQNPALLPLRWGYRLAEGVLSRLFLADNLYLVARKR